MLRVRKVKVCRKLTNRGFITNRIIVLAEEIRKPNREKYQTQTGSTVDPVLKSSRSTSK